MVKLTAEQKKILNRMRALKESYYYWQRLSELLGVEKRIILYGPVLGPKKHTLEKKEFDKLDNRIKRLTSEFYDAEYSTRMKLNELGQKAIQIGIPEKEIEKFTTWSRIDKGWSKERNKTAEELIKKAKRKASPSLLRLLLEESKSNPKKSLLEALKPADKSKRELEIMQDAMMSAKERQAMKKRLKRFQLKQRTEAVKQLRRMKRKVKAK